MKQLNARQRTALRCAVVEAIRNTRQAIRATKSEWLRTALTNDLNDLVEAQRIVLDSPELVSIDPANLSTP